MATPIAPTPQLTGQPTVDFFAEMEHHKKTTAAERVRVKAGADLIGHLPRFPQWEGVRVNHFRAPYLKTLSKRYA